MGKAAAVAAPKKPKPDYIPAAGWTIELKADGELNHADLEELAQIMADDFSALEAWKAMGKDTSGSPGAKRRFAEEHPVFRARLETLRQEKAAMEAIDPITGEVAWMAKQLWRSARAKGDIKAMSDAAKLALDVAKLRKQGAPAPADAAEEPEESEKRPVGRPVKENPAARRDPMTMRAHLRSIGRKAPEIREEPAENDD